MPVDFCDVSNVVLYEKPSDWYEAGGFLQIEARGSAHEMPI